MDGKMLLAIRAIELDIIQSDYSLSFRTQDNHLQRAQPFPQNVAANAPLRDLSRAMVAGVIVQVCPPRVLPKQHYFPYVLAGLGNHIVAKGEYMRTRETPFPV